MKKWKLPTGILAAAMAAYELLDRCAPENHLWVRLLQAWILGPAYIYLLWWALCSNGGFFQFPKKRKIDSPPRL